MHAPRLGQVARRALGAFSHWGGWECSATTGQLQCCLKCTFSLSPVKVPTPQGVECCRSLTKQLTLAVSCFISFSKSRKKGQKKKNLYPQSQTPNTDCKDPSSTVVNRIQRRVVSPPIPACIFCKTQLQKRYCECLFPRKVCRNGPPPCGALHPCLPCCNGSGPWLSALHWVSLGQVPGCTACCMLPLAWGWCLPGALITGLLGVYFHELSSLTWGSVKYDKLVILHSFQFLVIFCH